MIMQFELVKQEADQVTKQLVHRVVYDDDISSGEYMRYPYEVEELCKDGYAVERVRVVEEPQRLKLYFVTFAVHKGNEYHAAAGYIFANTMGDAMDLLEQKYGEIRLRAIDEVPVEEGTVLYGERWHKV